MWVDHDSFISNGRVIYSFESLITLNQPSRNLRGRQNDPLEIGPESRYTIISRVFCRIVNFVIKILSLLTFAEYKLPIVPFSNKLIPIIQFPSIFCRRVLLRPSQIAECCCGMTYWVLRSPYRFHSQNEIIIFPQPNKIGCGGYQQMPIIGVYPNSYW